MQLPIVCPRPLLGSGASRDTVVILVKSDACVPKVFWHDGFAVATFVVRRGKARFAGER